MSDQHFNLISPDSICRMITTQYSRELGAGDQPGSPHERDEQNAGSQHSAVDLVQLLPALPHRVPEVSFYLFLHHATEYSK